MSVAMKIFDAIISGLLILMITGVDGINIEGRLTVIKNDCYERMAIGEKLSPKQTYKSFEHNTVAKCEMECTEEKEKCRAYSFGIGPKGNATCLLSRSPVKETADLKPIGTISDTDYDLYIKKLDCQVVLEHPQQQAFQEPVDKPPNFGGKPLLNGDQNYQAGYGVQEHHNEHHEQSSHYGNLPAQSNHHSSVSNPNQGSGYHYNKPQNYFPSNSPSPPNGPPNGDVLHHIQTIVSIASGPQSVLHPVHDILVAEDAYGQGNPPVPPSNGDGYNNGNMPPFRPPVLNHPYENHRPERPPQGPLSQHYGSSHIRPNPDYGDLKPLIPPSTSLGYGYGHEVHDSGYNIGYKPIGSYSEDLSKPHRPKPSRPYPTDDRPDPDYGPRPPRLPDYGYESGGTQFMIDRRKYESHNYHSFESDTHSYGHDQQKPYDPKYNYYDHYDKLNSNYPSRYGSVIPHPNDYNRPDPHYDYLFVRPNSDPYKPSSGLDRPGYDRPLNSGYDRPRPVYGGERPINNGAESGYDRPERPLRPGSQYGGQKPLDSGYDRPNPNRPLRPRPEYNEERPVNNNNQGYGKPSSPQNQNSNKIPSNSYNQPSSPYPTKRPGDTYTSSSRPPSTELTNHYGGVDYTNKQYGKPGEYYNIKGEADDRKIVTQTVGYHGEQITSIITELKNTCFRRTIAGKRVVRGLVRKLLICDTVEQCQQECSDERRFTCEGFNYRLDPTGRGKGECELLDLPLSRIDIAREIVTDPDYDFYTRDRNAGQVNCRQPPSNSYFSGGGGHRYGHDGGYDGGNRRGDGLRPFDRRPTDIARPLRRPVDHWDGDHGGRRPRPPPIDYRPLPEDDRRPDYGNRRGDNSFHHSHESHSSHSHSYHYNEHNVDRYDYHHHEDRRPYSGIHYLPASPDRLDDRYIPPKRFPVIISLDDKYPSDPLPSGYPPPERYPDRLPEKDHWGLNRQKWGSYGGQYGDRPRYENNHNYYIPTRPQKPEIPDNWGLYGGTYGTGSLTLEYQGYGNRHNYWGFNKFQEDQRPDGYGPGLLPPRKQSGYLPEEKPHPVETYLPLPRPGNGYSLPHGGEYDVDNSILPAEPRRPPTLNFDKDECSLRSATGFRLHKGVVKKLFTVPNIYECELLCIKEKDFPCASYAFRYTVNPNALAENCYLSTRNYKELDYYTDLEPDRDFDIYTMNNRRRCQEPNVFLGREDSDCFWRVRSGQRLDHSVVRDSLTVKSTVDCQLECLKSRRFTCRAYSFRYGSPVIGGAIDNCQLTDWPFYELDPRANFITERNFEVYERGSYGHGCEPDHFGIRGKHPIRDKELKADQLCYIGFGSAAKLLPQATIKSVLVPTELDCKVECSKAREGTVFRCMSFSFVTGGPKIGHNCFLSDIMQRDLLPNVDYKHDPDSWLFTWDNYNPECIDLAYKPLHNEHLNKEIGYVDKYGTDYTNALDVWRVYSVSGWPCKRGSRCKENREAGFWYCELEGGEKNAWDYCCSPDHHCGFSNGYPYSWCYVGPSKTQWRKCNDQYYPYIHTVVDRFDSDKRPWHTSGYFPPPPQNAGYRPDRPNAPVRPVPPKPSLDQYEQEFDHDFLSPPKPGGFGQPRRWPVAYLHKEMPPNTTATESRTMRIEKSENSKLSAIKSLINVIKNTEIQNVQYNISNDSSKPDDVLYVKIPLPNLDDEPENTTKPIEFSSNTKINFEVVDTAHERTSRVQKSLPLERQVTDTTDTYAPIISQRFSSESFRQKSTRSPQFRRGFVTRTNITSNRT